MDRQRVTKKREGNRKSHEESTKNKKNQGEIAKENK